MKAQKIRSKIGQITALAISALMMTIVLGQANQPVEAQSDSSLVFIENVGQFENSIRFQTFGSATIFSLAHDALWFTVVENSAGGEADRPGVQSMETASGREPRPGINLKMSFPGANPHPPVEPFNRLPTHVSYFHGSNLTGRHTDVPVWGGVRYMDLYPGIDLEITGHDGQPALRLVQKDRAVSTQNSIEVQDITLQVDGTEALSLDDAGRLQAATSLGQFTLPLLKIADAEAQIAQAGLAPTIAGNIVTHPLSAASTPNDFPAQIASVSDLVYSTFLGGAGDLDSSRGLVVDAAGHAYVTGQAYNNFPTTPGAFDATIEGVFSDAFVAKINPDGSSLIYATFLGGSDYDTATGIVVDETGHAYLAGYTTSLDFPTSPAAFDHTLAGESDAFVAKFNPTGTALLFATYLGGTDNELCWGIDVDGEGNAYITGFTPSPDFPTTPGAYDTEIDTWYDVFVVKLNPDASDLLYGTFVGGNDADYSFAGVAVDDSGNAYVSGYTHSTNFPTTPGALDATYNNQEIFVFKLNPTGSDLVYSTYLGGTKTEYAEDIVVDGLGNVYLTGNTRSPDFPVTAGAFDPDYNSEVEEYEGDAFVAKLNSTGSSVVFATYLGGSGEDIGHALALGSNDSIYVTGETASGDFPTTPNAFDPIFDAGEEMFPPPDVFVTRLTADGAGLAYSTYLGTAEGYDQAYSLDVDASGNAYLTGPTSSADFPISEGAFDSTLEGFKDIFVTKLAIGSYEPEPTPLPTYDCAPTTLGTIPVGNTPRGIALDVAKQRVYVANYGDSSVTVINSGSNQVLESLTGISSANGIVYDGLHHMLWVTNYDTDQVTPIEVNEDATGFNVLAPVDVGDGPWGVVFDPIYGYLYVANSLGNSVSVINVASRTVETTLTETFNRPFHMATTPVTGKVYVANSGHNSVTVIKGTSIDSVVQLWDSGPAYGITVDETRNIVYVATVASNRIVAIGTLNGQPDQFLGWAAFYRGFGNRNRPLPLRAIAVNPDIGPSYDGGHIWATTSTTDGSELNQALFIPKGWSSYFHVPFAQSVGDNPTEGIAVDRINDLVYVASGSTTGTLTIIGDHADQCPVVTPATIPDGANDFGLDIFSRQALANGDANRDGLVDIFDLTFIAARYHTTDYRADVNGDGLVDIFDLTLTASRYGQSVPGSN
ncbi:MAG: SBBP repeat-containing protein [Anaerolineae bacterium]|nr:SBBP repeat-containing protein [Anaerolineae bacterium]